LLIKADGALLLLLSKRSQSSQSWHSFDKALSCCYVISAASW